MKIYVASSFSLIERVDTVAHRLEEEGHIITVKWWTRLQLKKQLAPLSPDIFYNHPECSYAYNRDFKGVKEADALVFVAEDKPRAYNGANVELGIALGDLKPCYSIGALENSALYYRVNRCSDIDDLLLRLEMEEVSRK